MSRVVPSSVVEVELRLSWGWAGVEIELRLSLAIIWNLQLKYLESSIEVFKVLFHFTTFPVGWVGGWLWYLEIRLSDGVWVEAELGKKNGENWDPPTSSRVNQLTAMPTARAKISIEVSRCMTSYGSHKKTWNLGHRPKSVCGRRSEIKRNFLPKWMRLRCKTRWVGGLEKPRLKYFFFYHISVKFCSKLMTLDIF